MVFVFFQVKKETQQLREFEEGLVSQYKFYLEDLDQTIKGNWTRPRTRPRPMWSRFISVCLLVFRLEAEEEEAQSGRGVPGIPWSG